MVVISVVDFMGRELARSEKECVIQFQSTHAAETKYFTRTLYFGVFKIVNEFPLHAIYFKNNFGELLTANEKRTYGYMIYCERTGIFVRQAIEFPIQNIVIPGLPIVDISEALRVNGKRFLVAFAICDFTKVDYDHYTQILNHAFLTKICEYHTDENCATCSKFKRKIGMDSFYDDFISVCSLGENGDFKIQIPAESQNKDLIVQIKTFSTKYPYDFNNDGNSCLLKPVPFSEFDKVKILRLQPNNLPFSNNYTSENFMNQAKGSTTVSTNRFKFNYDLAFNYNLVDDTNVLSIDKCFNYAYINEIYNNFFDKDIVIFAEYGVSLNYTGRLKATHFTNNEVKIGDQEVNNGVRCMDARVYGFNLGFQFLRCNTSPFLDNSVLTQQFLSKLFTDEENNFGFYDMLRFVVTDMGEYEWFAQPDLTQMQMRRDGFGIYIFFEKLGTYLLITFTAGALPYVITEEDIPGKSVINLKDRDYEDVNLNDAIVILRPTKSRLSASDDEYTLNMSLTLGSEFFEKIEVLPETPRFRFFQPKVSQLNLKSDIVFDCPVGFHPLYDLERNGNFLSLPVFGGLMPYLNIFYAYFFFTEVKFNNDLVVEKDQFFLTGTGYFNFLSGNVTSFYNMNGFYPFQKEENIFQKNIRLNLMNPLLKGSDFVRIQYLQIYRNRSYSQKVEDILENKISCLGILVQYTDLKHYLTSEGLNDTKTPCVEIIPTVTDYYPLRDMTNSNFISFIPPESKPIYSEKPFQFRFQPFYHTMKDVIHFKICGLNSVGEILRTNFKKGDEVMMKGSFVSQAM